MTGKVIMKWLLEETGLDGLLCISGEQFLNREIKGVHVMDNPDTIRFFRNGEIIMTTGYLLKEFTDEKVNSLARHLCERGCSGIIFKINRFYDAVPPMLKKAATQYEIPIITMPYKYSIADVQTIILRKLFLDEENDYKYVFGIYNELSKVVLTGGDIYELNKTLQHEMSEQFVLVDLEGKLLTGAEENEYLDQKTLLRMNRDFKEGAHIYNGAVETNIKKINATVWNTLTNNISCGYVLRIRDEDEIEIQDYSAIEYMLPLIGVEFMHYNTIQDRREAIQVDLLEYLLMDSIREDELETKCRLFGFDLRLDYVCVIAREAGNLELKSEITDLERKLNRSGLKSYICPRDHMIIGLIGTNTDCEDEEFFLAIRQAIEKWKKHSKNSIYTGIGSRVHGAAQIKNSFYHANQVLNLQEKKSDTCVRNYNEQLFLHILHKNMSQKGLQEIYEQTIKPIVQFDLENQGELLTTLKALMDCDWSVKDAAEKLFIHRNTLLNRREKMESLLAIKNEKDKKMGMSLGLYAYEILKYLYEDINI
ncbi:MAG: PucR family transcriptional regulator ligand-binding domain-containing protein [Lachnospiraceae bacterium]|nr:PucR family transcriptional regulator ligand-binding domain-containing protein [Lachnospiraceae bacterium]